MRWLFVVALAVGGIVACGGLLGTDDEDPFPVRVPPEGGDTDVGADALVSGMSDGGIDGATGKRTVFVTSAKHDGNFGGRAGGNALCNALANDAGLAGSYVAFLADDAGAFSVDTPGTWFRTDGVLSFEGNPAVDNPKPNGPVDRDEKQDILAIGDDVVWVGVGQNCNDWTSNADAGPRGGIGYASQTSVAWKTDDIFGFCHLPHRLYCFQTGDQ